MFGKGCESEVVEEKEGAPEALENIHNLAFSPRSSLFVFRYVNSGTCKPPCNPFRLVATEPSGLSDPVLFTGTIFTRDL